MWFEGSVTHDAAESRLGLGGCSQRLPAEAFGNPVRNAPDRGAHHDHRRSRRSPEGLSVRHNLLDALESGLSAVGWTTDGAPNQRRCCSHWFPRSAFEWPPNPSDSPPSALALRRPQLRPPPGEDGGTQHKADLRLLTGPRGTSITEALLAALRAPSGDIPERLDIGATLARSGVRCSDDSLRRSRRRNPRRAARPAPGG